MKEPPILAAILLLNLIHLGSSLVCLNCDDVFHPHTCKHVTECFTNEVCAIQTFISNDGDMKYKLGCVDQNLRGYTSTKSPVGHGFQACHEYCSTDLCNAAGCNNTGFPYPRGPVCYNCENSPAGVPCHKIEFCETHEACFNDATLEFQSDTLYTSGCRSKHKCANIASGQILGKRDVNKRSVSVCSDCCTSDICNTNCRKKDTCSDDSQCQLLMQNYNVCQTPDVAKQFCRKSCNMCGTTTACVDTNTNCYYQSTFVSSMCLSFQDASDNGCLAYCGYCLSTTQWPYYNLTTDSTMHWTRTSGYYSTTVTYLNPGDRVIRGPDWKWGTQDNNGPGTVLDHKTTAGWVRVRWDNGDVNSYRMGAEGATDLIRTGFGTQTTTSSTYNPTYRTSTSTTRTTMAGKTVQIGDVVVRGPDWKWGDQDKSGHGTVTGPDSTPGWVRVRWQDGSSNAYRDGAEGARDLLVVTPTTITGASYTNTDYTTSSWTATGSGVLAQQNKTKAHVVVKGDKEVKVGDPLSLECYGSETQLSFYINHRLSLSYKDVGGTVHNVSSSFYPSEEYKPLEESGELALAYEPVPDEGLYMFNISLQAAKLSDSGMYTCTLVDEHGDEMSSKSFRVTVLSTMPTYGPGLAAAIHVGSRVVRGRDWQWDNQDHGGTGTVTAVNTDKWVEVKWDHDGSTNTYRMGAEGAYDLMLAP